MAAAPGAAVVALRVWSAASLLAAGPASTLVPYVHPVAIGLGVVAVALIALALPAWRGIPVAVATGMVLLVAVALVSAQLVTADRRMLLIVSLALLGAVPGFALEMGPGIFSRR